MTALRYLILNEAGLVVNAILVDDPYPEGYWPGYGRYIVCGFGEADPTPPSDVNLRVGDAPFTYLTVRPMERCEIGDTMDIATGAVTPAPQPEPVLEEPLE